MRTKGKWIVVGESNWWYIKPEDDNTFVIAQIQDDENAQDDAEYICNAVNSHDKLRADNERLKISNKKDLDFLREINDRFNNSHEDSTQTEYVSQMLVDWIDELEKLLKETNAD